MWQVDRFIHRKWSGISIFSQVLLLYLHVCIDAEFSFPDFNKTVGLVFNGDASTSDCGLNNTYPNIDNKQGSHNIHNDAILTGESNGLYFTQTTKTHEKNSETCKIKSTEAEFGHRNKFKAAIVTGCSTRLRLTPSAPSNVGSVWYESRVPVLKGFDTTFTFQITSQSHTCAEYIGHMHSMKHHRSCVVHGGDGFAFVIHLDRESGTTAIGRDGQDLGYGGIINSIAVEFDTWTNVDTQGINDIFHDHISIHSSSKLANSPGSHTALGHSRPIDLADGKIHTARIQYLPFLEKEYLEYFTANENLLPYIKDNGEGRRLGTLAVFLDADSKVPSKPIIAVPLNLSILLNLPESLAWVGFTSSTGKKFENHDILSWRWKTI